MKKEFDSELVHNKKYLRAKIKSYNNKTPIFEIMEYPRKIPASNINILFLRWVKTIIDKYFWKSVNMLWKKICLLK